MVRRIRKEKGKRQKAKKNRRAFFFAFFLLLFTFYLLPFSYAVEDASEDSWLTADPGATAETGSTSNLMTSPNALLGNPSEVSDTAMVTDKTLTLKLMVVNPSTKYKQIFPLKAYLPEEVKVEHIIGKEDLEVGYDQEKKSFFVSKEIELAPGESVVKAVQVADIWFITEEKLNSISEEAHDVFDKLQDTEYSEQGRLLMNNIEVLLMQILERQNDVTLTPNEHIQVYRENKKKVSDIEMDLMAMRRFLAAAGEGFGSSKAKSGAMPGFLSKVADASKSGMVPASVLWRIIFIILIFLGFVSLSIVLVFQQQIRLSFSRRKMMESIRNVTAKDREKDKDKDKKIDLRISEFYPGSGDSKTLKADDNAA